MLYKRLRSYQPRMDRTRDEQDDEMIKLFMESLARKLLTYKNNNATMLNITLDEDKMEAEFIDAGGTWLNGLQD